MIWEQHQRRGYFGFDATGEGPPQFLHKQVVDIRKALEATKDVRTAWVRAQQHPGVPAFTGGLLDAWPQRMLDGFAVMNAERKLVDLYLAKAAAKKAEKVPA